MIKKEIIDNDEGHIIIKTNEPSRFEIINTDKGFVLHGYKGIKIDMKQEPILFHDTEYRD